MVPWSITKTCRVAMAGGLITLLGLCGCQTTGFGGSGGKVGDLLSMPSLAGHGYATVYTILCMETHGPDGARMVDQLAKGLRNVKGIDAKLVKVDGDGQKTLLYYGAYRGQVNKALDTFVAPQKAHDDINLIRGMTYRNMRPIRPLTDRRDADAGCRPTGVEPQKCPRRLHAANLLLL